MFGFGKRRRPVVTEVEFCDACAQVCSPYCRAQAQREQVQAKVASWMLPIR